MLNTFKLINVNLNPDADSINATDAEMAELLQFQGYTAEFFFWDVLHPTTSAHLTLAKTAAALLTSTPAQAPILSLI